MDVEFTTRADERLEAIYDHITESSGFPRRAAGFVAELSRQTRQLPLLATVLPSFYRSPVSGYAFARLPYRGYLLIYTVVDGRGIVVVDF